MPIIQFKRWVIQDTLLADEKKEIVKAAETETENETESEIKTEPLELRSANKAKERTKSESNVTCNDTTAQDSYYKEDKSNA